MARWLLALVATNMKANLALRGAFIARALFMAVNNLIWLVLWYIFFDRFQSLRGWGLAEVYAMIGITAGSWGLYVLFFHGLKDLPRFVEQGEMDNFLVQPRPVWLSVAGSASAPEGFGELISAMLMFWLAGLLTPAHAPALIAALLIGMVFWLALVTIAGSLSFWMDDMESWARDFTMAAIMLATWPNAIYSGVMKLVIFTVVPVAFLSWLPVEFIFGRAPLALLWSALGVAVMLALALAMFRAGLARYSSGNRFGVRA